MREKWGKRGEGIYWLGYWGLPREHLASGIAGPRGWAACCLAAPVKAMTGPALVAPPLSKGEEFSDWLDLGHMSSPLAGG